MKRYLFTLLALLFSVSLAHAQGITRLCITTNGNNCIQIDATNPLPVTSGGGASSTNITQILGNPVSATNPLYIAPSTGATFPVSGSIGLVGAATLTTAQVSVTTASTATVAARANRRAVTITNITGTQPIFCTSGTATAANGQFIPGVAGANFTFPYVGVVNCIAVTSAQTVSVAETY